MKQFNPEDITIIEDLPPIAVKGDKVALDTEFTGMNGERLHRPSGEFASLTCTFDGKTVYLIQDKSLINQFLKNLDEAVLIFHNAKFDVFHLRRFTEIPKRSKLWDCMIIEQIMYSGWYSDFSLADLVRRRLGIYMPKEERESFSEHVGEMTKEQKLYTAIDTAATWQVYQSQRAEISDTDLNIWKNIDLPALWSVLAMSGMKLDVEAWKKLAIENKAKADEIASKYELNLGSPKQVLAELHRLGFKKQKSTGEDELRPILEKCEFARDVLSWRGLSKAASTYGEKWITEYVESDGRIYSDFRIIGAGTGRFSSSNPNVENIPAKDTDAFRKCFIADEGNTLIDADWSAQEPRIAAYLSQDEQLINIFKSKKDVYIESAKLMFGWDLDKKDPRRKTRMKPTVLGASYGLTEYGMELKYGVPKEEGKEYLDTFFNTFTGMAKWKEKQQKIKTYVQTIYGRKFWLNYYQYGSENNALNSPVQGSAGDVLKIAVYRFLNKWGWTDTNSILVNIIHDEILLEVPKTLKDVAMQMLKETMIEVAEEMTEKVPADAEVDCGSSWADAHH